MAADVTIGPYSGAVPQEYEVPNSTEIIPKVVAATFDGTGAAGNFVPAIEIISDGGVRVALVKADATVTAGDTADVTFAPFLRTATTATGGGLKFDTNPQNGNFFFMETDGPSVQGLQIQDNGPGGLYLRSLLNGYMLLRAAAQLEVYGDRLTLEANNNIELQMFNTGVQVVIYDHLKHPIFEIREDGSIHGRAAIGAITWDL